MIVLDKLLSTERLVESMSQLILLNDPPRAPANRLLPSAP
jgi:hypothetical protein